MPQFRIRPIATADIPAILEVYRQCEDFLALGPVSTASLPMVLADLQHSKGSGGIFCCIFIIDNKMVGVVDYVPHHYLGNAQHAYLELLMIAQPYRRNGIGSAVVDWVETEIRKDPAVDVIKAGVQANNPSAISFWQKHGYRITGEAEVMPDSTICFPLEKKLTPYTSPQSQ